MDKQSNGKKNTRVRTWIFIVIGIIVLAVIAVFFINKRNSSTATTQYQTSIAKKGTLTATIGATGTVRSNQTAVLTWLTTGTIGTVNVMPGDQIKAGDVLATLEKTSLPQNVILAQADLVTAQQNLDNLKNSHTNTAQAQLNLVNAQKTYDNAKAT